MQSDDRAEYEAEWLHRIFIEVFEDAGRGSIGRFCFSRLLDQSPFPHNVQTWPEFAQLARKLARLPSPNRQISEEDRAAIAALNAWADKLEHASGGPAKRKIAAKGSPRKARRK